MFSLLAIFAHYSVQVETVAQVLVTLCKTQSKKKQELISVWRYAKHCLNQELSQRNWRHFDILIQVGRSHQRQLEAKFTGCTHWSTIKEIFEVTQPASWRESLKSLCTSRLTITHAYFQNGWFLTLYVAQPFQAVSSIVAELYDSSVTFPKVQISGITCCSVAWDISPGWSWKQWGKIRISPQCVLGLKF